MRLNQIQLLGSHNSYRRRTYAPVLELIQALGSALPPEVNPAGWDYDHEPLATQLESYGIRALELDLYNDPAGGRFFNRMGLQFIDEPVASNIAELNEPGMKVLHMPDFDYETHHYTFRSALMAIRTWSDAHTGHLPLFIQIETKEFTIAEALNQPSLGLTTALPFDASAADALDNEIRAVLRDGQVITPDEVRGTHASLEGAVLAGNWPLLESTRGRLLFFLEGPAVDQYLASAPGLRGRVMFADSVPGQEHAAIVVQNDPVGNDVAIADLVRRGYIVRTRADEETREARTGDRTRSERALESGAQIVSTDYYRPDPRSSRADSGWTNYRVAIPRGGPGRLNPVNGGRTARLCD